MNYDISIKTIHIESDIKLMSFSVGGEAIQCTGESEFNIKFDTAEMAVPPHGYNCRCVINTDGLKKFEKDMAQFQKKLKKVGFSTEEFGKAFKRGNNGEQKDNG